MYDEGGYDMKEVTITKSNFEKEVLGSDQPVLVDFWAAWCGPCKMLSSVLHEIAEEYAGTGYPASPCWCCSKMGKLWRRPWVIVRKRRSPPCCVKNTYMLCHFQTVYVQYPYDAPQKTKIKKNFC